MFKNSGSRKKRLCLLILLLVAFLSLHPVHQAKAQTTDFAHIAFQTGKFIWEKFTDLMKTVGNKVSSGLYRSVLSNAVNTIAYDTATWLGSGGRGQQPLFVTNPAKYAKNIGDAAAGQFIESLGDDVFGVDICSPSLSAKLKIGLGLVEQQRPGTPNCTLSQIYDNWSIKRFDPNFLKDLYESIDPTGTDLGAALYIQGEALRIPDEASKAASEALKTSQNFLTPKNAGGDDIWTPDHIKNTNDLTWKIFGENLLKDSGNALVDAAKVFTNQLALTAFKTQMEKIGRLGTTGTGYTGDYGGLLSAEANPSYGGAATVKNITRKIIEPSFATRGDYEILSQLTVCNQVNNLPAGPTDCVIDERFSQAVQNKNTVGEALYDSKLLNNAAIFGFKVGSSGNPEEFGYLEGIPYRSMLILRKYRIIPVGWELAAEYIKNHSDDPDVVNNATLGKMVACYSNQDSYGGFYRSWCAGLVDPDWVLKAPQNYCGKEGYGPQIISKVNVPQGQESVDYDSNHDGIIDSLDTPRQIILPNELTVARLDDYCADERSCIKERDDGSCQYYGYCEEEKREWRFDGESCEANFNTCETFRGSGGKMVSYLKNTLSFCSESDLGCKNYALPAADAYVAASNNIDWTRISNNIYLNKNAGVCDAEDDGCSALIRLRAGVGANILPDGNFEDNDVGDEADTGELLNNLWPITGHAEITDTIAGELADSGKVLLVDSSATPAGLYSFDRSASANVSVLPEGFVFEPETSYTLSADIYIEDADRVVLAIGRDGGYQEEIEITGTGTQEVSVSIYNNEEIAANQFTIYGYGAGGVRFYLDNVKLEVGAAATSFSLYGQKGLIHERILPEWLENTCYENPAIEDYRIRTGAPSICDNYARKCSREEAGCQSFTPAEGGLEIPAAVTDKDYCPKECEGYDSFVQKENNFNSTHSEYFIPATAQTCSAAEVGCEEFTNLDKSASGGEAKEYYSYLRRCVKPDDPVAVCADFYVWAGTGESGQQLAKISLQSDGGEPAVTEDDDTLCSEAIFNYSPRDPRYNPDCRQFYSQAGEITYHLYSRTISCTTDCHPYRLANNNYLEGITTPAACLASGYPAAALHWDVGAGVCNYCASGGIWSDEHNACIYDAYPAESFSCSASASGCSEYNGNKGNNLNNKLFTDFEDGDDGWNHGARVFEAISGTQSYFVNVNQHMHQLDRVVGQNVSEGQSYTLSFIAKARSADAEARVYLRNSVDSQEFEGGPLIIKSGTWNSYSINLVSLNHVPADDEYLVIDLNDPIYIDNIRLSLADDRYYLRRGAWNTPTSCDSDNAGRPYPLYMLGCSAYQDRLGVTHRLHNFDRLCQDSAIGCETMIDTRNSSPFGAVDYSSGSNIITVPADEVIYAVYDTDKKCDAADKGCGLLGEIVPYEGEDVFTAAYVKNNPDKYDQTLCSPEGVGCEKWTTAGSEYYFKDPGDLVCEWRQAAGAGSNNGWGWYKKKVKRCDGDGAICSSDSQCAGSPCVLSDLDDPCPTTQFKTFGQGGLGNEIYQPTAAGDVQWAGVCDASMAGCTEYIDPVSDFAEEIIYNGDFSQDKDNDARHIADNWRAFNNSGLAGYQEFSLEGNNLYILTVESDDHDFYARISLPDSIRPIYELSPRYNTLTSAGSNFLEVASNQSIFFYLSRTVNFNDENLFQVPNVSTQGHASKVSLKKAVISYQIADEVDKTSCNGGASLSEGCIYFNERIANSFGISSLNTAAFQKYDPSSLIDSYNSNVLIKVRPDRDCGSWLACKSYVQEKDGSKTCFEIASCNRLDDSGNCANFTVKEEEDKDNRTYGAAGKETAQTIQNLSGYSKVGYEEYYQSFKAMPNNLYSLGDMKQVGSNISVSNGDFELYSEQDYNDKGNLAQRVGRPVGWSLFGNEPWTKGEADFSFTVVADPDTADNLLIPYPMVGRSFLQYSLGDEDRYPLSNIIYVDPGVEYYLSYYINTSKIYNANAAAEVRILDGSGAAIPGGIFEQENLDGWIFHSEKFISPASGYIRLVLGGSNNASGKVYIDDIKISPVLLAAGERDGGNINNASYAGKTCRLYPEEDSLSCEYFDENGSLHRGEYGYCLEYDRYPGDSNACLLWWPIEKIQGSGLSSNNNSAGYSGRQPLYYCIGANTGIDISGANYPNIAGTDLVYQVEESLNITLNGLNVLSVGQDGGQGNLGDVIFPLRYGENIMDVRFHAEANGGSTFLYLAGTYNYFAEDGSEVNRTFDFAEMFYAMYSLSCNSTEADPTVISDNEDFWCEQEGEGRLENVAMLGGGNSSCGLNNNRRYITPSARAGYCTQDMMWVSGNLDIDNPGTLTMHYRFYVPELACTKIAQVVAPDGSNKAWTDRVKAASGYSLACNTEMPTSSIYGTYVAKTDPDLCSISDDILSEDNYSIPFGSIVLPEPDGGSTESFRDDPYQWSSSIGNVGNPLPLPYLLPDSTPVPYQPPYQTAGGHMGQLYSSTTLSSLFAQSYGVWDWNEALETYAFNGNAGENWSSPLDWCSDNDRGADEPGCAVAPDIPLNSIRGDSQINPIINRRGFVNLTFNSRVDGEQLPLTAYEIDWGDGDRMVLSGLEESDRQDTDNPHSVSHSYEYWDLKTKDNNSDLDDEMPTLSCPDGTNYCVIKPRLKIRDNWGWCTEGREGVPCPPANSGVCVNPNRTTNNVPCGSNYSYSYNFTDECSLAFPYCSDGFYEFPGVITVYDK